MKGSPRLFFLAFAGLAAWFGLALQVWVAFEAMWAEGFSTAAALAKVLSYFTILTNGLVALCYLADFISCLRGRKPGRAWIRNRSGVTVSIVMVGLGYELLLRHLLHFNGWAWLANFMVHDAAPVLFFVYWLGFVPKGTLHWRHPLLWLLYPVLYLPWALAYGAWGHGYPYPFIDVSKLGYPRVFLVSAGLFAAFAATGWALVALDRSWPFKQRRDY
jgi:hypothetical protein